MQKAGELIHKLEILPFWEHLSQKEKETVETSAISLQYQPGQQVQHTSGQCLGVLLVLSGVLRTYLLSPDGREVTLYRTRPGETNLLSASCVLASISFETHVEAEEHTEALLVPSGVYSAIVEQNLLVECDSYKLLMEGFSEAVSSIERLVFLSLEQRLASFLLDESAKNNEDTVNMTHEQIAVNIGSARVAVGRSLKSMAEQGLVSLFRGGIHLLDKKALYSLIR